MAEVDKVGQVKFNGGRTGGDVCTLILRHFLSSSLNDRNRAVLNPVRERNSIIKSTPSLSEKSLKLFPGQTGIAFAAANTFSNATIAIYDDEDQLPVS